jgi:hypothetical protein
MIRSTVKQWAPELVTVYRYIINVPLLFQTREQIFSCIYKQNKWGGIESRSGKGASLVYTESVRKAILMWVDRLNVEVMLDIPCGDFFWMNYVNLPMSYIGADIVDEIVNKNRDIYSRHNRKFLRLDLISDKLPKVDLVFCRDCLVHLSNLDVLRALGNIKASGSTYFATTTFGQLDTNEDIPTGSWRPLDLTRAPFALPEPLERVNETPASVPPLDGYYNKEMALWRVEDIP